MFFARIAAAALAAVLFLLWLVMTVRRGRSDEQWGVHATCSKCGATVPRWYFLDKGTPRGPYSRYPFPIPDTCRRCRHQSGVVPIPWEEGETEAEYDRRFSADTARRLSQLQR